MYSPPSGVEKERTLGANAMRHVAAGAHLLTRLFEPAKRPDDRVWAFRCSFLLSATVGAAVSSTGANTKYMFLPLSRVGNAFQPSLGRTVVRSWPN